MIAATLDDIKINMKMISMKQQVATLNVLMYNFLFTIAFLLPMLKTVNAQEGVKGNLVTVNWLEKNLKDTGIVILDASPSQIYKTKHIPGAISYDIFTYGVQEMPDAEIEKRYQSIGISPGKKIIMYDQGGTYMATRLLFSLYYYGFPSKNLFIVDGGLSKWQEAGFSVTAEVTPTPEKGSFTIQELNQDAKVDLPEFLTASGDPHSNVLLEALEPDWHFGGNSFFSRAGHIPNAIMLPSADFFNPDKTFKTADEIRNILAYMGICPEQKIYNHCGGGIAASVPFFALKFLLGYPHVKLFLGSQLEWVSDQRELPLWTYDAPYLMRETQWLQFWGGRTARMYGISQVALIDVRPTVEYNQQHIPYTVNIPSEIFRSSIKDPGMLTEIMGPAGVDSSHEAVVVSGKGLTKEAALAFLMLEKLGHKKISVLTDTHEKWEQLGFKLISVSDIEGAQKASSDLMPPVTDYTGIIRREVIITDPAGIEGIFPKVFIASGEDLSGKPLEGKVVHVPYTLLLDSGGKPKAAKDIWSILDKAGVPRYAELVCYSDDPGEAAVMYFILRLMGYPDIKVLVV